MRTTLALIIFRLIQIVILVVLLPFAVVGYIIFVVRLVIYSRRSGTSATVLASLYTRYMQQQLGTRQDEPAEQLLLAMPSVSPLALHLVTAPTLVSHRVTGYVPKLYRYPYSGTPPMQHQSAARTTYYDEALRMCRPAFRKTTGSKSCWRLASIPQSQACSSGSP